MIYGESFGTLNMPSGNAYSSNSSKVLVPKEVPFSKCSPVEVTARSNIDSDAESSNSVHFADVLSGAVGTAKIDL